MSEANRMTTAQSRRLSPRTRRPGRLRSQSAQIASPTSSADERDQQRDELARGSGSRGITDLPAVRVHHRGPVRTANATTTIPPSACRRRATRPRVRRAGRVWTCTDRWPPAIAAARLGRPTRSDRAPDWERRTRASRATEGTNPMTDDRERWALILGASSGMGEATARALAAGRLPHLRDPPRLPRRAGPRRGGQGGHRGERRRGPLHQHERRRRREAGRRPRPVRRAVRRAPGRRAPTRTSGS